MSGNSFLAGLLYAGEDPHVCQKPGWWQRRKWGVKPGAIWRCDCAKTYRWVACSEIGAYWRYVSFEEGERELRRQEGAEW